MPDEQRLSDVLSEFARTMLTDFPIQGILDHLVERIVDVLPVNAAGVTLISPGLHPRFVAASDDAALRFEKLQDELGEGPCVLACRSGQAVSVGDLRDEDRFPTFVARALDAGLRAVFTFPLRHGLKDSLGALDLYRDTPGTLTPETMAAAQTLADVAAAYLLNAEARTDLIDSRDRSREAALHDGLTGLPNRVLMLELLEHSLLRDRRSGRTSAVLFVDLDRFKRVNDLHGHLVGDELLVGVARRLQGALRPGDTLARFSGDEFVVLCEELETAEQAVAVAARLNAALVPPIVLSDLEMEVTASIGVAYPGANDHAHEALRKADMAMYQAKRQGGGRHQVLDLREAHLADNRSDLRQDLRFAAEHGELDLAYQPIVTSIDGCPTGVEAFLRWNHPKRGPISPGTVIPLAEQSGMISEIGQWVLERSWADLTAWTRQRPVDEYGISINVSNHQLMAAGFASRVFGVIRSTQINSNLLTLDLDESAFTQDDKRTSVVLQDLKDIGVTLALDNFGTGSSSLIYLRRFPIDVVKIDRTIVENLDRNSVNRTIVDAIVRLAHGLGMTVLAEGVETDKQHNLLTRLGCDSCQGYRFARPMPLARLAKMLRHRDDGTRPSLLTKIS